MRQGVLAALCTLLVGAACASSKSAETVQAGSPQAGRSNLISAKELAAVGEQNLLRAVAQLHPRWFDRRTPADHSFCGGEESGRFAGDSMAVFVDGVRLEPGSAQALSVAGVEEIRYYTGCTAATRFGTRTQLGALVIRRSKP